MHTPYAASAAASATGCEPVAVLDTITTGIGIESATSAITIDMVIMILAGNDR